MIANIKIFQIKDIENCKYAFRSFRKFDFSLDDYECVYEGENVKFESEDVIDVLEEIYTLYNILPEDKRAYVNFNGHALSMSDVVKVNDDYWYCDMCGWTKIEV